MLAKVDWFMLISMNRPPTKFSTSIHRTKTLRPFLLRKSISGEIALVADVKFWKGWPFKIPSWERITFGHIRKNHVGADLSGWFSFSCLVVGYVSFLKRYVPSSHFHTSDLKLALVFRMVGRAFFNRRMILQNQKFAFGKQTSFEIHFESVQWHWTSQACCIFLNDFAARNVHEDYNLLFSLIDRDQNGRSWKKWTEEGCSTFTGSPPKVHMISS